VINLNLTAHHKRLKRAFSFHEIKDLSIDCVLEGTMCNVISDCDISPAVFAIHNGPMFLTFTQYQMSSINR
jgi:hypothetical protein